MVAVWKIYGIFHPHTHDLLYVGQTHRAIHERREEHLLDIKDTLISKKIRQIKETTGEYPDFGILQDGIRDKRTAHYRELYHIYKHLSEGARLLNREARDWFYEGYDAAFSAGKRQAKRKRPALPESKRTDGNAAIPALKPETYAKVRAIAPGVDAHELEARWRKWLADKEPPKYPNRSFIGFVKRVAGGK